MTTRSLSAVPPPLAYGAGFVYGSSTGPADMLGSVRPEWLFELANRAQAAALMPDWPTTVTDLCRTLRLTPPVSPLEERILRRFFDEHTVPVGLERYFDRPIEDPEDLVEVGLHPLCASETVERAAQLLREECARPWTLNSLARCVGRNRTDLQTEFKASFGRTVHRYLTECRVEAAKALLQATPWRVLEIARAVGYRTKASLYQAFDHTVGLTPEQYRARWQLVPANNRVDELLANRQFLHV
jgi:AraC-like DNA-binding protein